MAIGRSLEPKAYRPRTHARRESARAQRLRRRSVSKGVRPGAPQGLTRIKRGRHRMG